MPGSLPKPIDVGHDVSPNAETSLALMAFLTSRQPAPYTSKCWHTWDQTPFIPRILLNATTNKYIRGISYSQTDCRTLCFSAMMNRRCNCSDYYSAQEFYFHGELFNSAERLCDYTN
ncbi:unnamed protein product, partial [Notodromas monacha]